MFRPYTDADVIVNPDDEQWVPINQKSVKQKALPANFRPYTDADVIIDDEIVTKPESFTGALYRGGATTLKQVPQLAYGVGALGGAVSEAALGTGGWSTGFKNWMLEGYSDWGDKIQVDSKASDSFNHSLEQAKAGDYEALKRFFPYAAGYGLTQAAQMLGGVGLLKAGLKKVSKKSIERMVPNMVAKESAKLQKKGLTKDAIKAEATRRVTTKLAEGIALVGMSFGMTAGEIGGEKVKEVTEAGKTLTGTDIVKIFGATAAAGSLEFVENKIGFDVFMGRSKLIKKALGIGGAKGRAARAALAGTEVAVPSAATEYGQTLIEEWGKGKDPWTPEARRQAEDAAAMGAFGAAPIGAGVGAVSSPSIKQPPPDISPLVGMIEEGLSSGELDGEPFSIEIAKVMMAEAYADKILTIEDIARIQERFPELGSSFMPEEEGPVEPEGPFEGPTDGPAPDAPFTSEEKTYYPTPEEGKYPHLQKPTQPEEPGISDKDAAEFETEAREEQKEAGEFGRIREAAKRHVKEKNKPAEQSISEQADARYEELKEKKGKKSQADKDFVEHYEKVQARKAAIQDEIDAFDVEYEREEPVEKRKIEPLKEAPSEIKPAEDKIPEEPAKPKTKPSTEEIEDAKVSKDGFKTYTYEIGGEPRWVIENPNGDKLVRGVDSTGDVYFEVEGSMGEFGEYTNVAEDGILEFNEEAIAKAFSKAFKDIPKPLKIKDTKSEKAEIKESDVLSEANLNKMKRYKLVAIAKGLNLKIKGTNKELIKLIRAKINLQKGELLKKDAGSMTTDEIMAASKAGIQIPINLLNKKAYKGVVERIGLSWEKEEKRYDAAVKNAKPAKPKDEIIEIEDAEVSEVGDERTEFYSGVTIGEKALKAKQKSDAETGTSYSKFTKFKALGVDYFAIEQEGYGWKSGKSYSVQDVTGDLVQSMIRDGKRISVGETAKNRKDLIKRFQTLTEDGWVPVDRFYNEKIEDAEVSEVEDEKVKFPTTYDEALTYIEEKAKQYGSKNKYYASEEYKKDYPAINKLTVEHQKALVKEAQVLLDERGLKPGDSLEYVMPDGSGAKRGNLYLDKLGMPKVSVHTLVSIQGETKTRKIEKWNKGWKKEKAKVGKPQRVADVGDEKVADEKFDPLALLLAKTTEEKAKALGISVEELHKRNEVEQKEVAAENEKRRKQDVAIQKQIAGAKKQIKANEEEIKDWSSRKYKKTKLKYGKIDEFGEYSETGLVQEANERRRQGVIASAQRNIEQQQELITKLEAMLSEKSEAIEVRSAEDVKKDRDDFLDFLTEPTAKPTRPTATDIKSIPADLKVKTKSYPDKITKQTEESLESSPDKAKGLLKAFNKTEALESENAREALTRIDEEIEQMKKVEACII